MLRDQKARQATRDLRHSSAVPQFHLQSYSSLDIRGFGSGWEERKRLVPAVLGYIRPGRLYYNTMYRPTQGTATGYLSGYVICSWFDMVDNSRFIMVNWSRASFKVQENSPVTGIPTPHSHKDRHYLPTVMMHKRRRRVLKVRARLVCVETNVSHTT
ncbi:hypothetical protein PoB_005563300 [Plakobranchus ocellatus]|uniref:Uncharacterized protein n=1 Tax=Plakobranchus ocellatus TaxID=259542 RepID=A0AAV4CDU2_9GAST|nr:hypothetical protein PoB_005563300 [Plakobranchus ocellatus]